MSEISPRSPNVSGIGFPGERVSPDERIVTFGYFECRSCGKTSEWVRANEQGNLPTTWDADHKQETRHKKFYMWTIQRNTSQVF